MDSLEKATKILGGRQNLCMLLEVDSPAYRHWQREGTVPAHQAIRLEYLTKRKVKAADLHPITDWIARLR